MRNLFGELTAERDKDEWAEPFEFVGVEDICEEQELVVLELEEVDEADEAVDELYEQLEPDEITLNDSI